MTLREDEAVTLVELGTAWINPEHVVSVTPEPGTSCKIHLVAGPTIVLHDMTADEVAYKLTTPPF